ncbi:hypothetical protein SOV88_09435 [Pectobacterium brasiliense]|uniref:hypothetical protein n=1 Tax=Pectobacterium brasiliense TaxID=180957 RepID=UPI002A8292FE|nr:hypothetical protein [Pectobacterium brasiliense]MDY4324491.1 hypothetical protein [Pectobacterium brasiliense]
MSDNTPLELEEIIDQCRALIYAVVELDEPKANEILIFVLWERFDLLFRTFHTPEVIPADEVNSHGDNALRSQF